MNKLYIIFFSSILFINIFFFTSVYANSFKITDLEISEPFDLNFNKEKVIDKGFKIGFFQLLSMITTSSDVDKLKSTSLKEIKGLIDSFIVREERFVNNKYSTKLDVSFNKRNTLIFFEKNNVFPSIPIKKNLLIIPILVDLQLDKIFLFTNNIFYENWNIENKNYFLLNYLLPSEDIEDVKIINSNSKSIEEYNFKEIINRYDLKDYIVTIIYKNNNNYKILSKIQLNQSFIIHNQKFENINLDENKNLKKMIQQLKTIYENNWKKINQINTSIKLPLTVSVNSKNHKKIQILEKTLNKLDLISYFEIIKFDNKNVYFKIVYNGSPKKFIEDLKENKIIIVSENQIWKVQ
mgnify:FL=1